MVSIDTIFDLKAKAIFYELDGIIRLRELELEDLARIYNGTGAEWMPSALRKALDAISKVFLPAILIHDVEFAMGDGTQLDFCRANNRLEYNMMTIVYAEYAWFNPMRYIRKRQARVFAEVCRMFGLPAYVSACEANLKTKGEQV